MFTVEIDLSDLPPRGKEMAEDLRRRASDAAMDEATETMRRILSGNYWQDRTGKTKASFKVTPLGEDGGTGARVSSGRAIARFINDGTKAHIIMPRLRGGASGPVQQGQGRGGKGRSLLRFVVNGAKVFARRVRHPGTKARNFITIESSAAEPRFLATGERAAQEAIFSAGLG